MSKPVFVFGSNLAGIHGAGAARAAHLIHGAVYGVGEGRTGNSYALPTKGWHIQTLPLRQISLYARKFCAYAARYPEETFFVTRLGCGLAGYQDYEIAPLFRNAPSNCILPLEWKVYLEPDVVARVTFHSWDDDQNHGIRPPSINHMPDN